ncbi:MAG: hypothetical protein GEV28_08750 [Actinophytocola sp.]|uniref:hypothetical protein n=1 Tax=Actinophytocola sp. TaxID=1872138 RepID=UPI001327E229|nr:hypothetical protein [Actinophytocola sp.]MPZ80466.1 hypothetical protein [Actinophytocola sp.]
MSGPPRRPGKQTPHHLDPGFNGPHFQAALNCWVRDVDLWHSDNGFGLTTSKGVTLTGVRVGGRARHHTFICRVQSHDMLVEDFEIPKATTPVATGAAHHGLNTEGFGSGNVWSNGVMEGTFDSHRALPFDSVRTAITVTNNGVTGGAGDAGPRWGARFCHWNIDVLGGRAHGIRLEEHAPYSAMVGIRGTSGPHRPPEGLHRRAVHSGRRAGRAGAAGEPLRGTAARPDRQGGPPMRSALLMVGALLAGALTAPATATAESREWTVGTAARDPVAHVRPAEAAPCRCR